MDRTTTDRTIPPVSTLDSWLEAVDRSLAAEPLSYNKVDDNLGTSQDLNYLPVGVGLLVSFMKLSDVVNVLGTRLANYKKPPAVFWLFAAKEPSIDSYSEWARELRKLYGQERYTPQVWIQVGGGAMVAKELALSDVRPDALSIQGSDAGGHGIERGASLIGQLPEVNDVLNKALSEAGDGRKIPHLLASGGIVDARGALAALTLGAQGVVMGTRFLASPETIVPHPEYQRRILDARDGSQSTIRAKVFDELRGPNAWPVEYDGRALVSNSWRDLHEKGVPIETIRDGHREAVAHEDGGYGINSDRAVIWAGTGVGLVNEMKKAGDVVRETRQGIRALVADLHRTLDTGRSRL
ncbi:hypothetical protein LTR05_000343 [Lithohypha guttulata]|uniref:Nitronate monooxygenase domain-containing protein n=1 Tax=Lithohypha guttulata TaxID=1690604 RepID=A0AAN7T549_9EURO|nr:hypothetical protein LTR05_000343 [Lithohypha guttulata]